MEVTPGDQETKNDSIISTGTQDGGPSFCTNALIFSGNNSGAKTLIACDIDKYLDIKKETAQDQETMSASNKSTETQDDGPYSCTTTQISVSNNSSGKTLIEYDIDESLDIKEEIVQEKNELDEKCITTGISSEDETGAKTLIEYNCHKTLKIKEEILRDQERHQRGNHNILSERNQLHGKCITTEMFSDNTSGSKTLIEYEYDKTLEIKEEIVQDQENVEERPNEKYELKLCTLDTNEGDTMAIRKPRTSKKKKKKNLQESKSEPKKKYNCDKCARSYVQIQGLYKHRKFDCGVMPQFSCEFCDKRFKRKSHMKQHIDLVHQKTNSKTSQKRHNCDKCSRSYSLLSSLYKHKRAEHAAVKIHFICDICGFKTKRKQYLSKHITSRHFQKFQESIQQPESKYKYEKCARSYVQKKNLYKHKKFECNVIPQFGCNFCGKKYKQKKDMNIHILHVHQKIDSNTSQTRHNCDKCSRSF